MNIFYFFTKLIKFKTKNQRKTKQKKDNNKKKKKKN